jgi:hypothetical protein
MHYVGRSLGVAGDNLNNIRHELSIHFRNKRGISERSERFVTDGQMGIV